MNDIILSTQNGEPVVSSREVAKNFGKEHKDVLKAINNLVAQNCAAKSMFHLSETTAMKRLCVSGWIMASSGALASGATAERAALPTSLMR